MVTHTVTLWPLCIGDAIYLESINSTQLNGVPLFENVAFDSTQRWVEKTQQIAVNDGKLTLTFTGTTTNERFAG